MDVAMERKVKREYKKVPNVTRKNKDPDPLMNILAREQRAREAMVAMEETKILAERVKKCYAEEGVNHYANCQKFTKAYFKRSLPKGLVYTPSTEDQN